MDVFVGLSLLLIRLRITSGQGRRRARSVLATCRLGSSRHSHRLHDTNLDHHLSHLTLTHDSHLFCRAGVRSTDANHRRQRSSFRARRKSSTPRSESLLRRPSLLLVTHRQGLRQRSDFVSFQSPIVVPGVLLVLVKPVANLLVKRRRAFPGRPLTGA
jgi:hypothetical protein